MPLPTIPSGNVASALGGGYEVANSCRFNFGDSPKLSKSVSSGSGSTKFTFSCWFKTTTVNSSYGRLLWNGDSGGSYETHVTLYADGRLAVYWNNGSDGARSWLTNRKLLDPAAWYHLAVIYDSTDSTAGDRLQIWINGVRETSFSESTNPGSNEVINVFKADVLSIGREVTSADRFSFDGYLAEVCVIDGTDYPATSFGEFSETSPTIWKPKDVSSLTFGTNGFYLDFEDSANLGNDANGGTDLDESNIAATDQCVDSPTNNFCTMNPLNISSYGTLSEGNCLITGNSSSDTGNVASTMAASAGKWYAECKVGGKTGDYPRPGFQHTNGTNYGRQVNGTDGGAGGLTDSGGVYAADGDKFVSDTLSTYGASFADNNIVNLAIDCDNGAAYVGVNGTWSNSSDPTSGASKTGAILTWTPADVTETGFAAVTYNSSNLSFNFGNPAYANSSDAADANGYGKFEYAPPTGFYALCTKNLAEFG